MICICACMDCHPSPEHTPSKLSCKRVDSRCCSVILRLHAASRAQDFLNATPTMFPEKNMNTPASPRNSRTKQHQPSISNHVIMRWLLVAPGVPWRNHWNLFLLRFETQCHSSCWILGETFHVIIGVRTTDCHLGAQTV